MPQSLWFESWPFVTSLGKPVTLTQFPTYVRDIAPDKLGPLCRVGLFSTPQGIVGDGSELSLRGTAASVLATYDTLNAAFKPVEFQTPEGDKVWVNAFASGLGLFYVDPSTLPLGVGVCTRIVWVTGAGLVVQGTQADTLTALNAPPP